MIMWLSLQFHDYIHPLVSIRHIFGSELYVDCSVVNLNTCNLLSSYTSSAYGNSCRNIYTKFKGHLTDFDGLLMLIVYGVVHPKNWGISPLPNCLNVHQLWRISS